MARKARQNAWLLLVVGLMGSMAVGAQAADTSYWLISKNLLDHAQLTLLWQTTLPVKEAESFKAMEIMNDRLQVRTSRNYMWSVDRKDGRVLFSRSIAPTGIPVLGMADYNDRLISVIGNQLVELDRSTGVRQRVSDLELSIVAPVVRNSRFFYVAGGDRRLHVLRAANMVQIFEVAAENESGITSVLADEDMVIFGTDTGTVLGLMADAPKKLWQFDAVEALAGPLVRDGNALYFANKDTNVYRVDMVGPSEASLVWKYQTEAILDREPRLTTMAVYQYALGRGLTAIDKQTGKALWSLPEGVDLLAEADGRAYVITKFKTLTVMDNATGKKLYWVNAAAVVSHAANTGDANIYLADAQGRVACLRPTR